MQTVTTIGLDIAKSFFQACATSHHWSRELKALGHTVRLMPPAYVKPYVKRQKNDAADAEAICEAVTKANMRFVETRLSRNALRGSIHLTGLAIYDWIANGS